MSDRYKETIAVFAAAAGVSVSQFERDFIEHHPHTPNGRAVAATIFYRAGDYWPDFFDLSDQAVLAVWADMFDTYQPFVTPDIAEQAVDEVHSSGIAEPNIGCFLRAAATILKESGQH